MHLAFSALISAISFIGFVHTNSLPYELFQRADVPTISIPSGTAAAAGEFRDIVSYSFCGGTLVAPTAILTAAHCVDSFTNSSVNTIPTVQLNTLLINGGGTGSLTRRVSKLYIHPSYNAQTFNNDIAILILNSPVSTIPPVKLPSSQGATTTRPVATTRPTACSCTCAPTTGPVVVNGQTTKKPVALRSERGYKAYSTYENQTAVIAGWGTTLSGGSSSNVLLKATIIIQPNTKCASQYSNFVAANMLCASAPGKDTCQGDSGGPIYVNGVQVGITSFGRGCALPNFAGVYTRVSTYIDWINTHLV